MARFAATMVLLSVVFWIVSDPPVDTAADFPQHTLACLDLGEIEMHFASSFGVSNLTLYKSERMHNSYWTEGGSRSWPAQAPTPEFRRGLSLHFNPAELAVDLSPFAAPVLGWNYPYWLVTAIWIGALVKYAPRWRFRVADPLILMGVVSVTLVAVQAHYALPLALFLNLMTTLVVCLALVGALIWFWRTPNPLWPLALEAENES